MSAAQAEAEKLKCPCFADSGRRVMVVACFFLGFFFSLKYCISFFSCVDFLDQLLQ